jgi:hypothetical protein
MLLAADREADHETAERGGEQQYADDVEARLGAAAAFRHEDERRGERREADRHVDEKGRAPAEATDIGGDQQATEQLPARHRHADAGHVDVQRPGNFVAGEQRA